MNGTVHSYNVASLIGSSNKQISYADLLRPFEMKHNEYENIESKFTNKVKKIYASKNGKRVLICFENNNFYVYNTRREAIDGVYIAQHAEEIKAIEWVSRSGKSLVTISDKLCLAKTKIADAGAWSSSTIDITEDMYSKLLHDTKNIQSDPIVKKFGKDSKNTTNKIALTSVCRNPIRASQIFCGDNRGYVHVVDINKGEKVNTYNVADLSIASLTSNGFYVIVVFADGS
jgi:hypothetical protein